MKFKYSKIVLATSFLAMGLARIATAQTMKDTIVIKEEKVINIAFGKQAAKHVTSAISTAYGSDLQKMFTTTIGNALYGRIAGLTVTQGGNEPGINSAGLNGRGNNTFGNGNDLLIIIDGYPGDLTQLVADEIDQISLLKDASATAIYGGRGANGVLLVTTKRGNISPLKINFSTQQGFSQAIALPKFYDSYNYATLFNEASVNDGLAPRYTAADLAAYQDGSDPYFHANVNWYDVVLKPTAPVANYNVNFRGGNNSVKYFVLLNAITSGGLYKNFGDFDEESSNANYTRYNFRTNIDVNLTKRLSANLLFGGTVEDKTNPGSLYSGGTFDLLAKLPSNSFPVYNPDGSFSRNSTFSNPYANLLSTGYANSNGRTLQSSFKLNYDLSYITEGLSVSAAASLNNYFASGSNFTKSILTRSLTKGAAGDTVYNNIGQTTSLLQTSVNYGQYRNFAIQAFVNYHRVFGKHNITALGMFNSDNSTIDKSNIYTTTNTANLSLPYKSNAGAARLTYVYNDKYIAEVSGSYMGTENFAPGKRYGLFPAVSLGWIASHESFLKNSKSINFLKLRGSYGIVGNVDIGGTRFLYDQLYPYTASYYFGNPITGTTSLAEGRRATPDATWEKEKKVNIGLDVTLFKNLDISVDVFNQDRYDILVTANASTPAYLGFTDVPYINAGKVNNKGFEFVVRYRSQDKKPLKYFVEANLFYAKNKRVYDAQPIQINPALVSAGTRLGQPFGLRAIGFFQSDADVAASAKPSGINLKPGDVKYQDIGGPAGVPDGIIDANDNQPIGNTGLPELTLGLHTGLQYKGFDIDLVFQAVSGNTVYLGSSQFRPLQNFGQIGQSAVDRWTPATASSALFPRLSTTDVINNYNSRFSSLWQRDGSFVKLRSAEIGYSMPTKWISRVKLEQARLFVNGSNLFSIDHISYGDPESLSNGYPSLRTITFGARIQF